MMKGPEVSYCQLMDEALLKKQKVIESQSMNYPLRPSAAGECSRKLYHELMAYKDLSPRIKEEYKPSVLRLFGLGHYIETQTLQELELLPDFTVRFKQQTLEMFDLPSGRTIEGQSDAVMWSDKYKALLDVKSVGDGFSSHRESRWEEMKWTYRKMKTIQQFSDNAFWVEDPIAFMEELGEDALVKNIYQLNLYAASPFLEKRGIDHAVILRYQKNASKLMEIRFKPSKDLFERTKDKFSQIETAAVDGEPSTALPPKDYLLGSKACAYCPYRERCWPNASNRERFASFPKKDWAVKIGEIKESGELRQMFDDYLSTEEPLSLRKRAEQGILGVLEQLEIEKIKLDNGEVFEMKKLKEGLHLRRSKE